jgi:hypothetical protein
MSLTGLINSFTKRSPLTALVGTLGYGIYDGNILGNENIASKAIKKVLWEISEHIDLYTVQKYLAEPRPITIDDAEQFLSYGAVFAGTMLSCTLIDKIISRFAKKHIATFNRFDKSYGEPVSEIVRPKIYTDNSGYIGSFSCLNTPLFMWRKFRKQYDEGLYDYAYHDFNDINVIHKVSDFHYLKDDKTVEGRQKRLDMYLKESEVFLSLYSRRQRSIATLKKVLSDYWRFQRKVPKGSDDIDLLAYEIKEAFMFGKAGNFFSAWDRSFFNADHKNMVDIGKIKDEHKKHVFQEYYDRPEFRMDYCSYLAQMAHLFAKEKALDNKGWEQAVDRRNRALLSMYQLSLKREFFANSDRVKYGDTKNFVCAIRKGDSLSHFVYKEGNSISSLEQEVELTHKIAALIKDNDHFSVPEPLCVFSIDVDKDEDVSQEQSQSSKKTVQSKKETKYIYAMERVEGKTLDELIHDGEDVSKYLERIVEFMGIIHNNISTNIGYSYSSYVIEKISSLSSIDENDKCELIQELGDVLAYLDNSYSSISLDGHSKNWMITDDNRICALDNEHRINVPFTDDYVRLTNFIHGADNIHRSSLIYNYVGVHEVNLSKKEIEFLVLNNYLVHNLAMVYYSKVSEEKNRYFNNAKKAIDIISIEYSDYAHSENISYYGLYSCISRLVGR